MELADLISDYVESISFNDLDDQEIHEAKRRILDSVAVAYGSQQSEPAKIARKVSEEFQGNNIMLFRGSSSPDMASFYNTLLIRYLDFNDTYLSLEPLHPSDMIGGLISLGNGKKGKDLILALIVGYEIGTRLCDSFSLRKKGFDHVNFLQVAAAAAMSKLLALDKKRTYNAISLSIIPHVALRQSRVGNLSMWKAGAAAEAIRNATFAVLLAKEGFTAPERPFSGDMGFRIIADIQVENFKNMGTKKILDTLLKKYPVEYHAQAAVDIALGLLYEGEIRKVEVEIYEAGKTILADKEKWNPKNKETADHSLPFIIAVSLLRREFWLDSYSLIFDQKIRELMDKIEIIEREDFTKVYPLELPTRITVYTDKGKFESEKRVPRGHPKDPMTDQEIEEKAKRLGLINVKRFWEIEDMRVGEFL
ncbi:MULTISPECIES: MmgE/PrpD family protein [Acidianus]|uniref:2-methylcitrate dehydratase n=1 Tax=Candidatus Acidianus copahuensis TaxID=1160895 RepID=A0A031LKH5_9CREN|nr:MULTISPECIES: MmgE/PrpD family protein [Acidianus]EZQ02056.1 2-methylcitrate dehydratase [Candidatus Acidianus copahuensis]NON63210.1 MmgE/PrpD family protein [Acidianus sp. RZ1]